MLIVGEFIVSWILIILSGSQSTILAISNSVELYLKNDYPLIIKYSVACLGDIKLCLAPKCQNN